MLKFIPSVLHHLFYAELLAFRKKQKKIEALRVSCGGLRMTEAALFGQSGSESRRRERPEFSTVSALAHVIATLNCICLIFRHVITESPAAKQVGVRAGK